MAIPSPNAWGAIVEQPTRSWEEVLPEEDRQGGASPWGNSKYSVAEQCLYKYWVKFVRRMKPAVTGMPLQVGGLLHEARARYYNEYVRIDEEDPEGTEWTQEATDEACLKALWSIVHEARKIVPDIANEVARLLDAWILVAGPGTASDDRHETILVEELLEVKRPFPYSARIDRVIWSDEYDGPVIKEIKTSAARFKDLLSGYRNDPQFLGQWYLWENSKWFDVYGPLKAFAVDLIIKSKVVDVFTEIVPLGEANIEDWLRSRQQVYEDIRFFTINEFWPKRRSNCVMYGRRCGLHNHCVALKDDFFPGWVEKEGGEF